MTELEQHWEALRRELDAVEAELGRARAELGGDEARSLRDQLALVETEVASLVQAAADLEAELEARGLSRDGEVSPSSR